MTMKTRAFNPIEMLHTDEEIAQWLTEAYEDEDPAVFVAVLGKVVKYRGVADMARITGLNRESLYKAFNGKSQPNWRTVHKLLHALNVKLVAEVA